MPQGQVKGEDQVAMKDRVELNSLLQATLDPEHSSATIMLDSLDIPGLEHRRSAPSRLRPKIVNVIPKHPAHRLRDRSQVP